MKPSYTWTIEKSKTFTVTVHAWHRSDDFGWNVYATIFENHPLFNNVEAATELPFHGGCTYDHLLTDEPAGGINYNWQKVYKALKVGSDYQHYQDDFFMTCNPADGIPWQIQADAKKLVQALNNYVTTEEQHDF